MFTFSDQERSGVLVVVLPEDIGVFDVACILQVSRVSRRFAVDSRQQGELPLLAVCVCKPVCPPACGLVRELVRDTSTVFIQDTKAR